jgi:hypothetical protein
MSDKLIFESPDGGKTVYSRPFGGNHMDRRLLDIYNSQANAAAKWDMWQKIINAAEDNPALQDLLDQAIVLYKLSEES